jgi:glycolate oxidase FAD binding subunit
MTQEMDLVGLAAGLESAGIAWRELTAADADAYAIDQLTPRAICWPATYEQAARCLAVADRVGAAVAPRGGGTKAGLGNRPRRCDLIVSTERLNQIVEYAPANLTVIAQAGVTLAALQATLGASGQQLPLDPPNGDRATLGGIVATNASGPWRLGYGSPRDLVIGTCAATTSGTLVRAGGKVVKNVAGYDLNKLYIGSLGTLVLAVEIGFKIAPKPAQQISVLGHFPTLGGAGEAIRTIVRSPLQPTALDLLNERAAQPLRASVPFRTEGGYLLAALGTAPGDGASRQRDDLTRLFRAAGAAATTDLAGTASQAFWTEVAAGTRDLAETRTVRAKVAVPIGRVPQALNRLEEEGAFFGEPPAIGAHAGSGGLSVTWRLPEVALNGRSIATAASLAELRSTCRAMGGSLVIEACPPSLKDHLDVWGDVGPALAIMRQLKATLDPNGILNPGRFVGGI